MKIDYVSDLHFNHWSLWKKNQLKWEKETRELTKKLLANKEGEVLVVAGDVSEWNNQTLWILDEVAKLYERVYFTYGNHDLYLLSKTQKEKYNDSLGRLNALIEKAKSIPGVVPLVRSTDVYKGVVFAGDALWYLPDSDEDKKFYLNQTNDSTYITIGGVSTSEIPEKLNKESQDWYSGLKDQKIDVFVSHVPVLYPEVSKYPPNSCYQTKVPFLVANHWVSGRTHQKFTFEKSGTKFYSNAIGYPKENNYDTRKKELINQSFFTVKTFNV